MCFRFGARKRKDTHSGTTYKGYIYSENVKTHKHSYDSFEYDGITYKYCDCGKINVRVESTATVLKADAAAIAATAAGFSSAIDGPLPIGESIGLGLMISLGLLAESGAIPSISAVETVYEDIDVSEYHKYKNDPLQFCGGSFLLS